MDNIKIYKQLDQLYWWFNEQLFSGSLDNCIITLHRKKSAKGFYSPENFKGRTEQASDLDELNLNPSSFPNRTDKEIASTLVHEMAHKYHELTGKPGKNGYHNKEWVSIMEAVGLTPVSLKDPEKKTGYRVTHTIDSDGEFHKSWEEFIKLNPGFALEHQIIQSTPQNNSKAKPYTTKTKYECLCGNKIWGKPDLVIQCGVCEVMFVEVS